MYHWLQRLFAGKAPPPPVEAPGAAVPAAPLAQPLAPAAAPQPPSLPELTFDQRDTVNTAYLHWLFDSHAAGLDTSPAENDVLDATAGLLKSQQSGAALVRRLPGLIPQLLQSLRSDSFSAAQLSRLISSDVVLVAAIIRVANSLYQGTGTHITSIEHAVILIGQEGLRQLITSVAFRPIIDIKSGNYTRSLAPRIWDQSERCATANRALAEAFGADPFEAFLAGLVQNVGLIVTLRILDQADKGERSLGSEVFCARLMGDARQLTCSIGREWNFPDGVVTAIAEQGQVKRGLQLAPPSRLLTLADYLSKLRLLSGAGRLPADEPMFLAGLPEPVLACYHKLDALAD